MSRNQAPNHPRGRIALGSLLLACAAAPASAAGFDVVAFDATYPLHEVLLYGSLALLGIALVLRIGRRRTGAIAPPASPDLRWWKHDDRHHMGA
jgi:hypothetical protein